MRAPVNSKRHQPSEISTLKGRLLKTYINWNKREVFDWDGCFYLCRSFGSANILPRASVLPCVAREIYDNHGVLLKELKLKPSCNWPRRIISLWDVEAPTMPKKIGSELAVRLSTSRADRTTFTPGKIRVLLSHRGRVDTKTIVQLEAFGQLKNSVTSSRTEFATFLLVV